MLSTTILVGHPFTWFAKIVEIEHRCYTVYTQTIDMILSQPDESIRDEEVLYLATSIIEDERPPFLMLTLTSRCILIGRSAVEVDQRTAIVWQMCMNTSE